MAANISTSVTVVNITCIHVPNGVHIGPYLQKIDTVKLLIRQRIVQELNQINRINEFNIFPSVHSACNYVYQHMRINCIKL